MNRQTNFHTNTNNNPEWLTPPGIITALGDFDLDPCSPHPDVRPWETAANHYHEFGLEKEWNGRVWCNPPYGRETFVWLKKAAKHNNAIALIFARTETIGFHEQIWNKASAVFFFQGRLKFHYVDGTQGLAANAPSCLVAYGHENVEAINRSGLVGKLVVLRERF